MDISAKIAKTLQIGGITMASCFGLAIISGIFKIPFAPTLAAIGVIITAATPVAGVVVAGVYLFKNRETKYFIYTVVLLIMMIIAGVWRLRN
jgi:hypothetical protein